MAESIDQLFDLPKKTETMAQAAIVTEVRDVIDEAESIIEVSNRVLKNFKSNYPSTSNSTPADSMDSIVTELSKLLVTTNTILEACKYPLQSESFVDPDLVDAANKLINTSKNIIKEFVSLFKEKMKFSNTLELEKHKAQLKMDVNEHKIKLTNELKQTPVDPITDATVVDYVQEDIIALILDQKKLEA